MKERTLDQDIKKIDGKENVADALTKSVRENEFSKLKQVLLNEIIPKTLL